METQNIKQLVSDICAGTYSQFELVRLIHLMQKISLGYLKYQEIIGKRIAGERGDTFLELEDLAVDCIAELFSRDKDGNFVQLKRYYEQKFIEDSSIDDNEVIILTRRLVVRKTKQELSRIFRERDPEGAKIVRNIKVAIRTSEKLAVFMEMGREYVFYKNGLDIDPDVQINPDNIPEYLRRSKPPVPHDVLHSRFIDIYSPSDSVSSSIRKILRSVMETEDYQNYLSLESLVKLIRRAKFDTARENIKPNESTPTPLDELESQEIESYIDVVMDKVRSKIHSQYLDSNKIDAERAVIYEKALRDVLFDLIQKKDTSSYFRNLRYYLPELTQKQYRQNERSIFEYLAKVAKREFRGHLKQLL